MILPVVNDCPETWMILCIVGVLSINWYYSSNFLLLSLSWDTSSYSWMIVFKLGLFFLLWDDCL